MGYTHYWEQKTVATKKQATQAQKEIEVLLENLPAHSKSAGGFYEDEVLKLAGGLGDGEPVINEKELNFNGEGENSHETFHIEWDKKNNGFCKTDRKPYDFAVCVCLLALAKNIPSFKVGSDGINDYTGEFLEDWKPAIDFYKKHIGDIQVTTTTNKGSKKFVIS